MEAIVLAGGKGTRLRTILSNVPKPMAPIEGKPFLEYLFKYLKKNEFSKVILCVGYKWDSIYNYIGDSYHGMEVVYSLESEPLGTGGAIKKALSHVNDDNVYVLNGDTFFDVNLRLLKDKMEFDTRMVLSLKTMHDFDRYGCVETDKNGFVKTFVEKKYQSLGSINGGVYLIRRDIFDEFSLSEKFSFEDFMLNNLDSLRMNSITFDEYFIDIGIPEDYQRAQEELIKYIR